MNRRQLENELGHSLSPRRREALVLMLGGASVKPMRRTMGLSQNTIRSHRQAIYARLGVHSHIELLAKALDLALTATAEEKP